MAAKRLANTEGYLAAVKESMADSALIAQWLHKHDQWESDIVNVQNHGWMYPPFKVSGKTSACLCIVWATLIKLRWRM